MELKKQNTFTNIFRVWLFLGKKSKLRLFYLLNLMVLSGFSEIASLALIVPFITIIANPEELYSIPFVKKFEIFIGISDIDSLFYIFVILFALFSIISGIIRVFSLWSILNNSRQIGEELTNLAYQKILYLPYEDYLEKNSSEQIVTLNLFTQELVNSVNALLYMISSLIIFLSIITSLLFLNWQLVFGASSLIIISYLVISFNFREKYKKISKIFAKSSFRQLEVVQQSNGFAKNIAIDNLYSHFLKNFKEADHNFKKSVMEKEFYSRAPRFLMDGLSLFLISIITIFLIRSGKTNQETVTILGVIALAGQKILPLIQQIYGSWLTITSQYKGVEKVIEIISEEDNFKKISHKGKQLKSIFKNNIELKNVSYKYKNQKINILENINLTIKKGSKVGIIGETGSGKSTFLNILMSLIKPSSGSILIDNHDLYKYNYSVDQWRSYISYVPQDVYLINSTIRENITFGSPVNNFDRKKIDKILSLARLTKLVKSKPFGLNTLVGERGIQLSGGQKQRIAIGRALYKDAKVLFFDEVTNGLDQETEKRIMDSIYSLSEDITIFFISHNLSILDRCDMVLEIKNGSINVI